MQDNTIYRIEEGDSYVEGITYVWISGNKIILVGFDQWNLNYVQKYEIKKNIVDESNKNCLIQEYMKKYLSNIK